MVYHSCIMLYHDILNTQKCLKHVLAVVLECYVLRALIF